MDVLAIQNLKKHFGSKEVLCGIDLSVPEHSIFGFIGKNGAGKTTAAKSMSWVKRCILDKPTPIGTSAICPMCQNFIPT